MEKVSPQNWSLSECARRVIDSEKGAEVEDLIWELRGTLFFKLKEMGKFDETQEGPDVQPSIDTIIKKLVLREY